MKKNLYIFFSVIALLLCNSYASSQVWGVQKKSLGLTGGYIHSKTNGYQASITFSDYQAGCVGYAQKGIAIGTEYFPANLDQSIIVAPKIGVHLMGFGLCLKLSSTTFLNDQNRDFRITPEIGIDILTYANITYGFNPHVFGQKIEQVTAHRLSFSIYLRKAISTYGQPTISPVPSSEEPLKTD